MNKKPWMKCHGCGCDRITEWTLEECKQSGVRIDSSTGEKSYLNADTIKILGITRKVLNYQCDNCHTMLEMRKRRGKRKMPKRIEEVPLCR